jgi:hypothetical protein
LVRSLLATICIGAALAATLTIGETANGATPSPIVYAVNPFGNEPGYPGITPFQLSTGAITESKVMTVTTGPFAGEPIAGANGLAQDPTTDIFYAAIKFGDGFEFGAPRHLATVDVTTGVTTPIGPLNRQIAGLAFRTDGTLYAVSGDGTFQDSPPTQPAHLFQVNKATGGLTMLTNLGTTSTEGEAIAYNPIDDMIYHASGDSNTAIFEKIDPDNSFAQTPIGFSGGVPDQATGIGFDGTDFVITDTDAVVWSVTPAGVATLVGPHDDDFFMRGVVVGAPVTVLDFGDAPDGVGSAPNTYPTLLANDGARHVPSGPILGEKPDAETDAFTSADGTGDDDDGVPDENGVRFHNDLLVGEITNLRITTDIALNDTAEIDAWIDYNRDGDWDDQGEQIFNSITIDDSANSSELSILIPATASPGVSYARFRISSAGDLDPTGEALDGEVEDYQVLIKQRLPNQKYRCGQEVKGNVKLNTDLLDCPEDGLVVVGRDTTVNLNGFTLDGSGTGVGIRSDRGKRNTVVKGAGGTIQQFAGGVSIGNECGEGTIVKGVNIEDTVGTGIFVCGPEALVVNNTIDDAGTNAIGFAGVRNTITGNTISDSGRDGIHGNCCGPSYKKNVITNNTITNSGEDGIEINQTIVTVKDNQIFVSEENGLIVNGGNDVETIKGRGNTTSGDPCLPARLCLA